MRRLVMGGFPCSATAWETLFPSCDEQQIVPFSQIFSSYDGSFFSVINGCQEIIKNFQPTSIILHDISVSLGLLSLIRLQRYNYPIAPRVVIFNGAFRGFNVFKAPHPLKIQFTSFEKMAELVSSQGGIVDLSFKPHYKKIRKFYRQIIFGSIAALVQEKLFSKAKAKIDLKNKILIFASNNDKYIPRECLERIQSDFLHTQIEFIKYGHFPYSCPDYLPMYHHIVEFENSP